MRRSFSVCGPSVGARSARAVAHSPHRGGVTERRVRCAALRLAAAAGQVHVGSNRDSGAAADSERSVQTPGFKFKATVTVSSSVRRGSEFTLGCGRRPAAGSRAHSSWLPGPADQWGLAVPVPGPEGSGWTHDSDHVLCKRKKERKRESLCYGPSHSYSARLSERGADSEAVCLPRRRHCRHGHQPRPGGVCRGHGPSQCPAEGSA
jgi:hypothetical protein